MAELNFNALATPGPRGFYQGFEQGKTDKLTTDITQFKFDELKRDRDEMLQLQIQLKSMGQDPDIDKLLDVYVQSGKPDLVKAGIEGKQKLKDLKAYSMLGTPTTTVAESMPTNALASNFNIPVGVQPSGATTTPVAPQTTVNNMVSAASVAPTPPASTNAMGDQVLKTQQRITQLLDFSRVNPRMAPQAMQEAKLLQDQLELYSKRNPNETPDVVTMRALGIPITQEGFAQYNAAKQRGFTPPSMVGEYNFAKTSEGGGFKGTFQEFVTTRAAAGRPPAQPRAEQPLVAVVGPDGNPVLVSRENAVNKTPANTVEKPMTEGQRLKYNKDKVSDKDVVTGAFAVTGELEKLTDELVGNPDKKIAPAPGLSSITGFSALTNPIALPSGNARKALQKLETFKGKIMALGRQLASQEGKLGNMAVQEWKFVSDAVQKIDPAAGNLDEQMRDVVRQAKKYAQRQQNKYDENYADEPDVVTMRALGIPITRATQRNGASPLADKKSDPLGIR